MQVTATALWLHTFHTGSLTHLAMVTGLAIVGVGLVAAGRAARRQGPTAARQIDRWLAAILLTVWVSVQIYDVMPARRGWGRSLPLHVCHVAALAAPVALATRRRSARAILYFWGVGLSTQALVTPTLYVGPAHTDFWVFWGFHGAIVLPAAYDLAARHYRPRWKDWRLAVAAGLVYLPLVFAIDWRLWTNYAWLRRGDCGGQRSLLSLFGPWPGRVPCLALAACGAMTVLALAWPRNWPRRRPRQPQITPGPLPLAFPVAGWPDRPVRSAA